MEVDSTVRTGIVSTIILQRGNELNKPLLTGILLLFTLLLVAFTAVALAPWERWHEEEEERKRLAEEEERIYALEHPTCCWTALLSKVREYTVQPGILDRPRAELTLDILTGPVYTGTIILIIKTQSLYSEGEIVELTRGDNWYDGMFGEHWQIVGLPKGVEYAQA